MTPSSLHSKTWRFAIPLFFLIGLILLFWFKLGDDPRRLPSPLLNQPAPAFSSYTLEGASIDQTALQGHITVLNVWSTWCLACHQAQPFLMDLAQDKSLQILGLDYKDATPSARAWLAQYGNPYAQCIADQNGELALQFGVYGTPEQFLIDQEGVIRYKHIGPLSKTVWASEFAPRVKELQT